MVTALFALAVVPAGSAASRPWQHGAVERAAGPVAATLSFERQAEYGTFRYRHMELVVRERGKTVLDRQLCTAERCSFGSQHTLKLENVWGTGAPEVIVDIYTGGAHCCFESLVVLVDGARPGRLLFHEWGDPGYRGEREGSTFDFVSADDRFAYEFTSFAGSGLPVQVWSIDGSGRFAEVTQSRLDLIRADAKQFWRGYLSERGKQDADVRGVVAAWCADEYRLGLKQTCAAELATAATKGYLSGPTGWPRNAAFVRALGRSLAKWGYGTS